jgi:HTH-type transcriptional repressor of NAD biosynthesis genes
MMIHDISLQDQIRWLKVIFRDIPHIKVLHMIEDDIPAYPAGVVPWCDQIKKTLGFIPEVIFSSEPEYDWWIKEQFAAQHVVFQKESFPTSATNIRSQVYKNWEFLPGVVRPHFVNKVVITGTESCGKSTLVKLLAKRYNTSWVEEFGKNYVLNELCGAEDALVYEDYPKIAFGHKLEEEKAIRSANKVCIIDTDAVITQFYCQTYSGKPHPIVEEIANFNKYDMHILLSCDVPWVADGLRSMGEQEQRESNQRKILQMYGKHNIKPIVIGGNYHQRFQQVCGIIDDLLARV